jgi:membrane protease YdiL (CAAX protease family)
MAKSEAKSEVKTDYLSEVKNIVSKDKRDVLMLTTKASVNGAVTGLVLGLMVGYYKSKNIYVSGLIGAVIGGVATAMIVNKK